MLWAYRLLVIAALHWHQRQHIRRVFLNRLLRIEQGKILSRFPKREEIGVVPAARLAALAWSIDRQRVVEVAQIEDLTVART